MTEWDGRARLAWPLLAVLIVALTLVLDVYAYSEEISERPVGFEISNLTVTPKESFLGEPVEVAVDVTNLYGETKNFTSRVLLDEVPHTLEILEVPPKETIRMLLVFNVKGVGVHTVKIGV